MPPTEATHPNFTPSYKENRLEVATAITCIHLHHCILEPAVSHGHPHLVRNPPPKPRPHKGEGVNSNSQSSEHAHNAIVAHAQSISCISLSSRIGYCERQENTSHYDGAQRTRVRHVPCPHTWLSQRPRCSGAREVTAVTTVIPPKRVESCTPCKAHPLRHANSQPHCPPTPHGKAGSC